MKRDEVLNYRPGPASERPLDDGETVQATFTADRARYWKDHAAMAALGSVAIAVVLLYLGKSHQIPIAVGAVFLGLAARGAFFASEARARRWQLTDRRLIGPQGQSVMLLEIARVQKLLGDVQVVTKTGAKHLIKHLADGQAALDAIERARTRRAAVAE